MCKTYLNHLGTDSVVLYGSKMSAPTIIRKSRRPTGRPHSTQCDGGTDPSTELTDRQGDEERPENRLASRARPGLGQAVKVTESVQKSVQQVGPVQDLDRPSGERKASTKPSMNSGPSRT